MTCREKLAKEHPEKIDKSLRGGCFGCPHTYGYLADPDYCTDGNGGNEYEKDPCDKCWDREIP